MSQFLRHLLRDEDHAKTAIGVFAISLGGISVVLMVIALWLKHGSP